MGVMPVDYGPEFRILIVMTGVTISISEKTREARIVNSGITNEGVDAG